MVVLFGLMKMMLGARTSRDSKIKYLIKVDISYELLTPVCSAVEDHKLCYLYLTRLIQDIYISVQRSKRKVQH